MTADKRPNRSRARTGAAGDALILMAITLVAVAVGLGLHLQIGMGASAAAVGALALLAVFVGAHVLVRRSQAIRELTYEVDRLESEMMRLARGMGPRSPAPPVDKPDQQLSSYRPGPQGAPVSEAKAPHSLPVPNSDLSGPQSQDRQAPSNPPSRRGDAAAASARASEEALDATAKDHQVPSRSAASQTEPPVGQRPTASQPDELISRFWSVRPTDMAEKPGDPSVGSDRTVQPNARAGAQEAEKSSKDGAGRAPAPHSRPDDRQPQPGARRQHVRSADGGNNDAAAVDVNAINDMIRMFSEEIASPRKAPPSAGAPAPQAAGASGNEKSDTAAQEEAIISASVGALRAAADEMRRPPEPGRAATAIERGDLPRFQADPTSPAPQPPPVGPEHAQAAAMAEAIAMHKLDVFLEPVVGLADRKARHFNVSLRLRVGESETLGPEDYVPLARRAGLLPLVDATRAARAAIVARHMDERGSGGYLFSAITAESLTSERFLQDFAEACRQSPKLRERLVFSIAETELRELSEAQWGTIQQLAGSGFRFAIQDLTTLDLDLAETKSAGFAFVRVAAQALLDGISGIDGVLTASDLCQRLTAVGLSLIAFDLENEEQLDGALAAGVTLGQGRLFGVPRPIRSEALRPARSAAA